MATPHEHNDIVVHCPRCDHRATIDVRSGFDRLTCGFCGFTKKGEPPPAAMRERLAI